MKLRWVERKVGDPGSGYIERVLQVYDYEQFNQHTGKYGMWLDVQLEPETDRLPY